MPPVTRRVLLSALVALAALTALAAACSSSSPDPSIEDPEVSASAGASGHSGARGGASGAASADLGGGSGKGNSPGGSGGSSPHNGGAGGSGAGGSGAGGSGAGGAGMGGAGMGGAGTGGDPGGAGGNTMVDGGVGETDAAAGMVPVCDPSAIWGSGSPVPGIPTGGSERLLAVTADERYLLFATDEAGVVFLASRTAADLPFGAAKKVSLPPGYGADGRAALGSGALRLVIVRDDGLALAQISRDSEIDLFSTVADEAPFASLNQISQLASRKLASPVFSAGGERLYLVGLAPSGVSAPLVISRGADGVFGFPTALSDGFFVGLQGSARLLTGVAPDETALFLRDEGTGEAQVVWSTTLGANLEKSVSLGARQGAQPAGGCHRLYSWSGAASGHAILVSTP